MIAPGKEKRINYHPIFIVPLLLAAFGIIQEKIVETKDDSSIAKVEKGDVRIIKKKSNNRPNIIFILSDDQDTASLQAMPRLLRSFPLRFQNHILTDPVCCPSRETFMTGQYAHNHGVRSNSEDRGLRSDGKAMGGWYAAGSRQENIALWLQESGYRTALVGKYLNGFEATKPVPRGWSDTFLALDNKKGYFNYSMLDNGREKSYGESPWHYSSTVLTNRAISNIKKSQEEDDPLFLFLSYNTPHNGTVSDRQPRLNPEPHPRDSDALLDQIPDATRAENFDHLDPLKPKHMQRLKSASLTKVKGLQLRIRSRWQSLYSLDREIGRLLRAVRKTGEMDNTYFFFTTDNGYFLGNHRLIGKFLPYDEATRFPLLVRGPGIKDGQRSEVVGNIDFVPTVLDIARAKAPKNHTIDGRSLLPLMRAQPTSWRQEIVIENFPSLETANNPSPREPYIAIRSANDVFIRYQKNAIWPTTWNGEEEYYNLREDPHQLSNAVDDPRYKERVSELRRKTAILKNCSGEECP